MIHLLKVAVDQKFISEPHLVYVPDGFPLFIAASAVKIPKGCTPPTGQPVRIGTGTHPTKGTAAVIAMAEAVERYSLQFDPTLPDQQDPVQTLGGTAAPLASADLRIGAPGTSATSVGCAAQETFEDAIQRAALEHLEHIGLAMTSADPTIATAVDTDAMPAVLLLAKYLKTQLRDIRAEVCLIENSIVMARAICCDFDGARATEGSAAGHTIEATVLKAAEEAVISWRNMIELERNAIPAPPGEAGRILKAYRGAATPYRAIAAHLTDGTRSMQPSRPVSPLHALAAKTGQRLRVFDMTHPTIQVPVARIVIG